MIYTLFLPSPSYHFLPFPSYLFSLLPSPSYLFLSSSCQYPRTLQPVYGHCPPKLIQRLEHYIHYTKLALNSTIEKDGRGTWTVILICSRYYCRCVSCSACTFQTDCCAGDSSVSLVETGSRSPPLSVPPFSPSRGGRRADW